MSDVKNMYDLQHEYLQYRRKIKATGGFSLADWLPAFKDIVRPLYPGELVVIMADTGVGKTAILQNIACAARDYGDVLMFELELPGTLCFERFAAIGSRLGQTEIARRYDNETCVRLNKVDHISVCDKADATLEDMHKMVKERNCFDVIMIDYIGLIKGKQSRSRYERMSDTAEQLKVFARMTNSVVIVATQIHRKGDEYVEAISLHDAKDSGSIENAADLLLGAYRVQEDRSKLFLKVLKNRKGQGGSQIEAHFDGETMSITPKVEKREWDAEELRKQIGDYA